MPDAVALLDAKEHAEAGRYDKAWPIVSEALNAEPDDPKAMCLATYMLERQGNPALAYQVCKRLTTIYPNNAIGWLNLGKCCDTLWRMEEAESAYRRSMNIVKVGDNETKISIHTNFAALYLQLGRFNDARGHSELALKLDPNHLKSRHNLGISLLAAKQWRRGWEQYEASVGSPARIAYSYGKEPVWKGEPGKTVAIYGEQGLGDEICAASMYEDAIERSGKVIIDCDARLAPLFTRSFPGAKVYGTRTQKVLNWHESDHKVDYSISAMQLGAIFRREQESFRVKPYLTADPERVLMWKALWKSLDKPVVGVAWTGGLKQTGSDMRSVDVQALAPIMQVNAHFVNLQYKPGVPPPGMATYAYATLGPDYDQTAALVASLDAVVSVPTTVAHLAGALGIQTIAMKAKVSCWKYESGLPFHPCHLIENDGDWGKTIDKAASRLHGILYG